VNATAFPPELLTRRDLRDFYRLCKAQVYRLMATDSAFAKPIIIGPKTIRWRKRDVDAWLDARQGK
jgi:predicted DNA-binding transcriptional regulator AlpA